MSNEQKEEKGLGKYPKIQVLLSALMGVGTIFTLFKSVRKFLKWNK